MKTLISILATVLSSVAFAGGGSSIGPANPAAVNCLKLEGTLEPYHTPEGDSANCVIEAWHLFDEMCKRDLCHEHHYPRGGMPNPAAVNCLDIGGKYRSQSTPDGSIGFCVVEQWTLFHVINVINE